MGPEWSVGNLCALPATRERILVLSKTTNLVVAVLVLIFYSNLAGAKPNAATTGYTGTLTQYTGPSTITQDGITLENMRFNGIIRIAANNVTIRNCLSQVSRQTTYNFFVEFGYTGTLIEDCEIRGAFVSGVYGAHMTLRGSHIWEMGSDAIKSFGNFVIENNYVERLHYIPDAHADVIQHNDGDNLTVRGNNFECFLSVPPDFGCSIAIFINDTTAPVDNVHIDNNWLDGGNYTLQIQDPDNSGSITNVRVTNNQFGQGFRFGAVLFQGTTLLEYCGNRWESTQQLLNGQSECSGGSPPVPQPEPEPEPEPEPTQTFVAPPSISPQGGLFTSPVSVTLSSEDGGTIYYTLDGSTPNSNSAIVYTGPVVVADTTEFRSIVELAGGATSQPTQANFLFGDFPVDSDWVTSEVTRGDHSYVIEMVVTPEGDGVDFVLGLGNRLVSEYADTAVAVRFAQTGQVDVRNGDRYQAERLVEYDPGRGHKIRMETDLSTRTYSVWVELTDGTLARLAKDFSFRTQQSNISEITNFGAVSLFGRTRVSNLEALPVVPEETPFSLD